MNNQIKRPWYLNTLLIACLSLFGILIFPLIIAIILIILQWRYDKQLYKKIQSSIEQDLRDKINESNQEANSIIKAANDHVEEINCSLKSLLDDKIRYEETLVNLTQSVEKLEKQQVNLQNKSKKIKLSHKSVMDSVKHYRTYGELYEIPETTIELLNPTVTIPIHSMDVKQLRTQMNNVKKEINTVLDQYETRYTTKANKSIYSLIVIGLQSELQNVLYTMKYDKKEKALTDIENICMKYMTIAGDGNKSIYSTLVRFIGEVKSLFISLVNTEYEYYLKREQEKEEQRAIKEQMRQEAAERKQLEAERKKVENEEKKYTNEITSVNEQLQNEKDATKLQQLEERLKQLEAQLKAVEDKKEEISNLQNGKAGNVYIISNIGSFGDEVFKIGMTRRLDPMDRVKELGDASVPFSFDVHSFIFSDDAPRLENELHTMLENQRVNKVNKRKEFFRIDIDQLEELVQSIEPTAEFTKTIIAQEYKQTLRIQESNTLDDVS